VEPAETRVRLGEGVQLRARLSGREGAVKWSVADGMSGSVTSDGYYRAPVQSSTPATIRVIATVEGEPPLQAESAVFLEPVGVAVEPEEITLSTSESQPFRARVKGTADERVTWSVEGGETHGSITPGGLFTSPRQFGTPGAIKIRATSLADPTKSAVATVQVQRVELKIEPKEVTLKHGESRRFEAKVSGTGNTAVTWSVLNDGTGQVSASGLYTTAPVMQTPAIVTVIATSVADPSKSVSARVRVEPIELRIGDARAKGQPRRRKRTGLARVAHGIYRIAAPRVVQIIMPFDPVDLIVRGPQFRGKSGKQYVPLGGGVALEAYVQNSANDDVRWEMVGDGPGKLSEDGLYLAPDTLPTPQVVQVRAVSAADPTKSVVHTLHIPPVVVQAQKAALTCMLDGSVQLAARANNAENDRLTWSVEGGDAFGTVSETGLYHPPASLPTPAVVRVRATSEADPTKHASIEVRIPEIRLEVSPDSAELRPGRSVRLKPRVLGCRGAAHVEWRLLPEVGTITPDGVYTAPENAGAQVVQATATLRADPTKTVSVTLRLRPR
jgi:hypothetical protein